LRDMTSNKTDTPCRVIILQDGGKMDVMQLIAANPGATFQVASQLNCLEMVDPDITPADGIDMYARDNTQGPYCSIACAGGTLHRNYSWNMNEKSYENTEQNQVHNADKLLGALGGNIKVQNGYTMHDGPMPLEITQTLQANKEKLEKLKGLLKVGFHQDVGVTYWRDALGNLKYVPRGTTVTQVFCSGLAFQNVNEDIINSYDALGYLWHEALYEATLRAAHVNAQRTGNKKVFLTLIGGGAFNNKKKWIVNGIAKACTLNLDLDVYIVQYGDRYADDLQAALGGDVSELKSGTKEWNALKTWP